MINENKSKLDIEYKEKINLSNSQCNLFINNLYDTNKITKDKEILLKNSNILHFQRNLLIYTIKIHTIERILGTNMCNQLYSNIYLLNLDTGSGKTTQICQYLNDFQFLINSTKLPIVISQPRRTSCQLNAKRVEEESKLKIEVFLDWNEMNIKRIEEVISNINRKTNSIDIIFITEYVLMRYLISKKEFNMGNILIIDEAHERTLVLDIILYIIKNYILENKQNTREIFKLIIASASLDNKQYKEYFSIKDENCIKLITKNKYKIEYKYIDFLYSDNNSNINTYYQYVKDILYNLIFNINTKYDEDKLLRDNNFLYTFYNDTISILAFLPTYKDIHLLYRHLNEDYKSLITSKNLFLYKLHSGLDFEEQKRIIQCSQCNIYNNNLKIKVILSTNLAETSLTFPNLNYVIDSGYHKTKKYNYSSKLFEERIEKISKESANQRAGRTGRMNDGICYRAYSHKDYLNFDDFRDAEVNRVNISYLILKIMYFGVENINTIKLIDQPSESDWKIGIGKFKKIKRN